MATLMECGHTAHGHDAQTGEPVCVMCVGIVPGARTPAAVLPDLTGRVAVCGKGCRVEPSRVDLAFFEYRGPGSREASMCECGYSPIAHRRQPNNVDPSSVIERGKCTGYRPRGGRDTDSYYCGCRGWD